MSLIGKQILLYVFLPLLVGFLIYFFFRPGYWFIQLIDKREPLIALDKLSTIEKVFIFSGADFCWAFSFSSALFLWEKKQDRRFSFLPILILLILVGSEFIQRINGSGFTLDWYDVFAVVIAFCLTLVLIRRKYEKK